MPKFRKKPVVVDAVQFNGSNTVAMSRFMDVPLDNTRIVPFARKLIIKTLEGDMTASEGDWIIKGVQGEFYPCKPDIFADTYEPVDAAAYLAAVNSDPT